MWGLVFKRSMSKAIPLVAITSIPDFIKLIIISTAIYAQMYDFSYAEIFLTIPRFLLSLSLILPFTIVFCILPLVITLNIFGLLIFILSPLILGYPISMLVNKKQKYLAFLALIIFYPVVGSLFTCLFFIIILLYPFLR